MGDFEEAFKRYIPRSEWEALKAEWRVEEEGRKAAGAGGKPEGTGRGEGSGQNSEAGTHGSDLGDPPSSGFGATRAAEDDAAAA